MPPDIRYARSGDVSIAYLVHGDGPIDLVYVHGFVGHLELEAEDPSTAPFFERLCRFARVITFDRRGTGLSDRVRDVPSLETRMDDVRAVLDAAGAERALLFGTFEAGAMSLLFAATYPERTAGLALYNPVVKGTWSSDFPWAPTEEEHRAGLADLGARWGSDELAEEHVRQIRPSHADDQAFVRYLARMLRAGASPGAAVAIRRMVMDVDVRDVLPAVRVPALVLHSPQLRESAVYASERIPGARLVEVPGDIYVKGHGEELHGELERFARSAWGEPEPDTVLATVLFTDLVGSTERAAELGDRAWTELVERHHAIVRRQLDRFRGRELDTAGDGFFAAFDGPIRAIRCAQGLAPSLRELGLEVRAGLHTGECERVGEKLGGLAVSIGARVASLAGPGEVLVSSTVKDLVAGSGIAFDDRGEHELKGVPGSWRVYAAS
ncbi:MAG TPA: adenylate/guanylate cyclase domain-containing protein [Gaiellaceae bacterium]|jgi:class 3 adenylate cyclase